MTGDQPHVLTRKVRCAHPLGSNLMTSTYEVPVLIVGGGPVGLSASILLSRLGIRSLLVERHPRVGPQPRARGVSVRTMEIFRPWGIEGALRAVAVSPEQFSRYVWAETMTGP